MLDAMSGVFPRLAATERGTGRAGPIVVFVHGLGCERGQFVRQMEGLDPRLRLLSLDLPGHGDSPELSGEHTIALFAAAVSGELRARAHTGVVLVGHSAGGLIALKVVVEHPDLVRGVLVLDTTTALSEAELRTNKLHAAESQIGDWRGHFMASMAEAWGTDDGAAAHLRPRVFGTLERTPEHVARPLWNDILAFESESLWRACQVPSLYVRAKRETDLALLRTLNPLISTLDLRPQWCGHWPHLQRPHLVNEALHAFVARLNADDG